MGPALAEKHHFIARKLNPLYCVYTNVDKIVEGRRFSTSRFDIRWGESYEDT
jgi:hypothetical protein